MAVFQWTPDFETGIATVDDQHHRLVDLVNRYGDDFADGKLDSRAIGGLVTALSDYAHTHFQDEETLMEETGVDHRHLEHHRREHADFLAEVRSLHSGLTFERTEDIQHLQDFLIHWLAFHILGADQLMARQMEAISAGSDPAEAYVRQEVSNKDSTEPLMVALNSLFSLVSERNRDLVRMNGSLERKVEARTRELQEANRRLEELALTDTLTGLYNRRYAMKALATLWEESRQSGSPLACMMIDVDEFKQVNDTWGHDAGDDVLTGLARELGHHLRTDDLCCRLGGDEFFVICPRTDLEGAEKVAGTLLEAVNSLSIPTGGGFWKGRISVGIAVAGRSMNRFEELVTAADRGVYAAKDAGRNCIRVDPETR